MWGSILGAFRQETVAFGTTPGSTTPAVPDFCLAGNFPLVNAPMGNALIHKTRVIDFNDTIFGIEFSACLPRKALNSDSS